MNGHQRAAVWSIALAWAQTIALATLALAAFCGVVWMLAAWLR